MWVEKNTEKSYDIPVLGWVLSWAGKHRLRGFLLTREREEPLENHGGNGLVRVQSRFLMGKRQSKKVKLCMFSVCTECELQSRDPKGSDHVKWK